jgi:toxin CcdB
MNQFDVYANPIAAARTIYPYVVVLQSNVANFSHETVVAPIALQTKMAIGSGRLMPQVNIEARDYVVLTASLTTLPTSDLKRLVANLGGQRAALLGAIDLLFFGV